MSLVGRPLAPRERVRRGDQVGTVAGVSRTRISVRVNGTLWRDQDPAEWRRVFGELGTGNGERETGSSSGRPQPGRPRLGRATLRFALGAILERAGVYEALNLCDPDAAARSLHIAAIELELRAIEAGDLETREIERQEIRSQEIRSAGGGR